MSGFWRPTVAEINLAAIRSNVKRVARKVLPAQVMAVVKGDAYGHGSAPVARAALQAGAAHLGVAMLEEGVELRKAGIQAPIVVLGGLFSEHAGILIEYDLEAVVQDLAQAQLLSEKGIDGKNSIAIHIKVDTGMGRLGVHWQQAEQLVSQIEKLQGLTIRGLCTHFACSDCQDKTFANLQLARFQQIADAVASAGIHIPLLHAANSGAILDLSASYFDMVRLGISMYGYYPSSETSESISLQPALTLKSKVMLVKEIKAGESVSYNRTYTARKDTKIAMIPIGYADGYSRKLSNKSYVVIRGERFKVAGIVCMDQIMVDVGDNDTIRVGDEAILLGSQQKSEVSIYELCRILETIPYEVTTGISGRVPRIYVNH